MNANPITGVRSGVILNVAASVLFAVMYAYTGLLSSLSGEQIYGWRILLTIPCLTLLIIATGKWQEVKAIWKRVLGETGFWAKRLLSSFLLGVQLWLFMWAPVNGHALDVSLGYFLLPLTAAVVGRFAFNEKLSGFQRAACLIAGVGVINELVSASQVSWPTFLVCLGYPLYFYLRRVIGTNNLGGLWFDLALSLPVSLYFITTSSDLLTTSSSPVYLVVLILGLGGLSACALACSAMSAPKLNLALFGLLTYVEPVLLVFASLILGETIKASQWPTYIAIWLAICVLVVEGLLAVRRGPPTASDSVLVTPDAISSRPSC